MIQETNSNLINSLMKETLIDLKQQITRIDNYLMVIFSLVIVLLIISGYLNHYHVLKIIFQSLEISLLFALLIVCVVGLFQYRHQYFIFNDLPQDTENLVIQEKDIFKYYQEELWKLHRVYQRKNTCLNTSYILIIISALFLTLNIFFR
ncbi:hypothetical protein IQ215_01765 [Cyanobacterium stanieri LEGE 03274]|uniref:DUF1230 domain-containing protein n=1 Tax=Cyanobacterium stanieri LEGE 03274 TaxID=1828756 RepID=A0ABR9V0J7_9CHRO|nr:hypothetical protein [Cyanobacterium stanieri]MBE9221413.1 hypothetical protein [Cyanobacterium stanieri LEGE 03274]